MLCKHTATNHTDANVKPHSIRKACVSTSGLLLWSPIISQSWSTLRRCAREKIMQGPCLVEEAVARPWEIYLPELSGLGYGIAWSPRLALHQPNSLLSWSMEVSESKVTNLGIRMSLSSVTSQWNFMTTRLLLLFCLKKRQKPEDVN